jgi:hypothetical protein
MGIDYESILVYGWEVDYDKLRQYCLKKLYRPDSVCTTNDMEEQIDEMLLLGFEIQNEKGDLIPHTSPFKIAAIRQASPGYASKLEERIWVVNLITDDELSVHLSDLVSIPEANVEAARKFAQSVSSKQLDTQKIYSFKHIF